MYHASRYTANLAAHLTASFGATDFKSVDDLRQHNISIYFPESNNQRRVLELRFPDLYKEVVANNWLWKEKEEILDILDKR